MEHGLRGDGARSELSRIGRRHVRFASMATGIPIRERARAPRVRCRHGTETRCHAGGWAMRRCDGGAVARTARLAAYLWAKCFGFENDPSPAARGRPVDDFCAPSTDRTAVPVRLAYRHTALTPPHLGSLVWCSTAEQRQAARFGSGHNTMASSAPMFFADVFRRR